MAKYEDSVDVIIRARNESAAEMRRAEQEAKAATDRETRRAMDTASERAQVEQEIRDASLRAQGRHVEADLDIIRRGHNQRIRAALDANDLELADRLATLRDLRIAEEKSARQRGALVRNVMENQVVGAAVKATASFGLMELALGGVNTFAEALSGDLEDAAEAAKKLPAGIGPFARQLEEVLAGVSGIRSEIEQIEAVNRVMERGLERQKAAQEDLLAIAEKRAETQRSIRNEIELALAAESDRAAVASRQQGEERLRQAQQALEEAEALAARGGLTDEDAEALRKNRSEREELNKFINDPDFLDSARRQSLVARGLASAGVIRSNEQLIAEAERRLQTISRENVRINNAASQRARQAIEAAQERLALEQQAIEIARQRRAEDEASAQQEAERVMREAEIAEEQKRIAQQQRDLEREAQRQEREAQRQELDRLKQQRGEIAERIKALRDEQRDLGQLGQPTPQNTADQNRFLSGVSERSAEIDRQREDREREASRQRERQIERLEMVLEELTKIQEQVRSGTGVVIGGVFSGGGQ